MFWLSKIFVMNDLQGYLPVGVVMNDSQGSLPCWSCVMNDSQGSLPGLTPLATVSPLLSSANDCRCTILIIKYYLLMFIVSEKFR